MSHDSHEQGVSLGEDMFFMSGVPRRTISGLGISYVFFSEGLTSSHLLQKIEISQQG